MSDLAEYLYETMTQIELLGSELSEVSRKEKSCGFLLHFHTYF